MIVPQWIELLALLVQKDVRVRYLGSTLGYLWVLLAPMLSGCVYYFAFKVVLRVQVDDFPVYLLCGLFPWHWTAGVLSKAAGCMRANASLVKRVTVPRALIPLSLSLQEGIHLVFAMPVLLAFIVGAGRTLFPSWFLTVPLMLVLHLAILYPLALMVSLAAVQFRDLEHLVSVAVTMLFFLSPVTYPETQVPDAYLAYYRLNPLGSLIVGWHQTWLAGAPSPDTVARLLGFALVIGVLGRIYYARNSDLVGELL